MDKPTGKPAISPPGGEKLTPTALSPADLARILTVAGGQTVTVDQIAADVTAGAPTNGDGTINLVRYGAWLIREMSGRGD